MREDNHQATFWVKDDQRTGRSRIGQGDYVETAGDVFLVIEDDSFSHEGGFTKCVMQKVPILTGRERSNYRVDKAIKEDY